MTNRQFSKIKKDTTKKLTFGQTAALRFFRLCADMDSKTINLHEHGKLSDKDGVPYLDHVERLIEAGHMEMAQHYRARVL